MVKIILPAQLQSLAKIDGPVELEIIPPVTQGSVLDALEICYPMLRGTTRDQHTKSRRAYVRFFACGEDLSHQSPASPLPEAVADGREPFLIVGAMSGG